ncbi:MAG: 23S rRNA (cytosine1962-C5)-methyltransferase [Thiomicrorhabdus sp.]|nr:MAG: 23S rRNA (cytosine1962-C5)-methyltransferase [Thiomicrorhabdus sp.]
MSALLLLVLTMFDLIDFSLLPNDAFDETNRLFHGRGHAYPNYEHISIDWLSPVVLITFYKEDTSEFLQRLAQQLFETIEPCTSVQVQYRYLTKAPFELLLGDVVTETVVIENGLKYNISLGRAQNTGLFLDMRNGRQWVQAHSKNANVLNLFSYTCGFSLAAMAGGASGVLNVDMSRPSLTAGRENHRLNKQDVSKVNFQAVDIFKSFGRIKKYGPYDLMVCDPPSFQKGSVDIKRDYKKIIRRIPEFMKPNALLMLCLNSPDLDEQFLKQTVIDECPACDYIEALNTPEVFVEVMQGKGLKVLIYRYNPAL